MVICSTSERRHRPCNPFVLSGEHDDKAASWCCFVGGVLGKLNSVGASAQEAAAPPASTTQPATPPPVWNSTTTPPSPEQQQKDIDAIKTDVGLLKPDVAVLKKAVGDKDDDDKDPDLALTSSRAS